MNPSAVRFHQMLEKIVLDTQFGQLTVNVVLKDGVPLLKTFNVVKTRRKKYVNMLGK